MDLRALDLPAPVRGHFEARGIESLYPPQAACVDAGITDGENVLAAVPTASGKTFVATLAMLSTIRRGEAALYVVPLRALATEKAAEFDDLPGVDVGVATGDLEAPASELAEKDIVVATSEKVDSMIRHGVPWLREVGCVVVDEIHLLDSRGRGPTLEVTIAKLRELRPPVQIVGLSATVGNADDVAGWLDATLVEDDWRPVDLRRGVHHDGRIAFADGTEHAVDPGGEPATALVRDTLSDGAQCLVFVHSRRAAQDLARSIAAEWFGTAAEAAAEIDETATTGTGEALADCIRDGVAFHHAGLRAEHRTVVEDAFRDREIDVICATPTLAAGVNIPARRVIVRDHWRYTDRGREEIPVLEVHQMFGRAGRPGLDPYGEAILVADSADEADELHDRYLEGEPEPVESKLASQDALRTHVLSAIASGFADTRAGLLSLLEGTFYAHQADHGTLVDIADLVLDYLESVDMVEHLDGLAATELGEQVSRLYVDPQAAAELVEALRDAEQLPDVTTLTVLELVCNTPDLSSFYLRGDDHAGAHRFVQRHESEFVTAADGGEQDYDAWLATAKTVLVLADWIDGVEEGDIVDRHGIGPGDLRSKVERAVWMLNAAESLAELEGVDLDGMTREAREAIAERIE